MNSKIKSGLLTLAAAALLASQAAFGASPIVTAGDLIKFADGDGASPGGAFIITDYDSTGTTAKGSFQAFCVEYNETMSFGPFYKVASITKNAMNGGVAGGNPDPLDARTAWLYQSFIENQSAFSAVAGWSSATAVDKGTAMQKAVWYLEQEITSTAGDQSALANALLAAASTHTTFTADTSRVWILNVQTTAGGLAQDQLYITPVPEPEIYAMLAAGLGLMGFVARRRKQQAA